MNFNNSSAVVLVGYQTLRSEDLPKISAVLQEKLSEVKTHLVIIGAPDSETKQDENADFLAGELNTEALNITAVTGQDNAQSPHEYLHANYAKIIAVWDGIYTGKEGDLSEIIRHMLKIEVHVQIY